MSGNDAVGVLLETFTWIGFAVGAICLIVACAIRVAGGQWIETIAVIMRTPECAQARWMTTENTIHSRQLDPHEDESCGAADATTIFYSRRTPERMRFHPRSSGERIAWLLFLLMGGVGLCSVVVSTVLLFLPE